MHFLMSLTEGGGVNDTRISCFQLDAGSKQSECVTVRFLWRRFYAAPRPRCSSPVSTSDGDHSAMSFALSSLRCDRRTVKGPPPRSVGRDHTKADAAIGGICLKCLAVSCRSQPTTPQSTRGGAPRAQDASNACLLLGVRNSVSPMPGSVRCTTCASRRNMVSLRQLYRARTTAYELCRAASVGSCWA